MPVIQFFRIDIPKCYPPVRRLSFDDSDEFLKTFRRHSLKSYASSNGWATKFDEQILIGGGKSFNRQKMRP